MFVSSCFVWGHMLPHVPVHGDRAHEEVRRLSEGPGWGLWAVGLLSWWKRQRPRSSLPPPAVREAGRGPRGAGGQLSPGSQSAGTLILGFQSPEWWGIKVCCLRHPVCGVRSGQPMRTTIPIFSQSTLFGEIIPSIPDVDEPASESPQTPWPRAGEGRATQTKL